MNVIIEDGPAWSIGLPARVDGNLITIDNHMGEPHWYDAANFAWRLTPDAADACQRCGGRGEVRNEGFVWVACPVCDGKRR
jgi:hypothetical protein